MTTPEFDASTSSPRHGFSATECGSDSSPLSGNCILKPPTEFHATIADITDDEHVNTPGLVQEGDFNADVVVRFLRNNGIDACVDESTGGFRFKVHDPARESHVRFACVCLRASMLCDRGRLLVHQGEAMMSKRCAPTCTKYCNGHHRSPPVELLSARVFRLRIARGYSIDDLAMAAHVFAGTITASSPASPWTSAICRHSRERSECRLVCGEHSCAERACDEERTPSATLGTVSNLEPPEPQASVPRRRRRRRFGTLRREIDARIW